jgi:hypothetical protein
MTRESGAAGRTFKSALIWSLAEGDTALKEAARKLLAWQAIQDEADDLRLDEGQKRQLTTNVQSAERDVTECVWRSYKYLGLLDKQQTLRLIDLGLVHSGAASSLPQMIIQRLRIDGDIEESISPNFLVRNWSPAFSEWSTRAVRDAFFASPVFPRLMRGEAIRDTIAKGVTNGLLAYVGKTADGRYDPFFYRCSLNASEVELSHEMFIITRETAEAYLHNQPKLTTIIITPQQVTLQPGERQPFTVAGRDQHGQEIATGPVDWHATGGTINAAGEFQAGQERGEYTLTATAGSIRGAAVVVIGTAIHEPAVDYASDQGQVEAPDAPDASGEAAAAEAGSSPDAPAPPARPTRMVWSGEVPWQKWQTFYMKIVSKFVTDHQVHLNVHLTVTHPDGLSPQHLEDVNVALRELGLDDEAVG